MAVKIMSTDIHILPLNVGCFYYKT
uniref:Uncharacterized protein n=1 Tax=Rhizophora mucronata TaxID=61149 RepID=A0A2P2QBM5_RHIMU